MPKINKPFVPQQPGAGTDNYIDGGPTRAGLEELRGKVNAAPTTWATVAEAEAASYTEPESVVVAETGTTYTYSASSEATRDGIRVLTPDGGGRLLALIHGGLNGLTDDDHSQYALLAGRGGGQTINGSAVASGNLTLSSTANETKGKILLGADSAYDEVNDRLGIGQPTPTAKTQIKGSGSTSATTAFKVDNSSDTKLFEIADDGKIFVGGATDTGATLNLIATLSSAALKVVNSWYPFDTELKGDNITIRNRYNSGSWARNLLEFVDSANTIYFRLGALGSSQVFTYGYIGTAYNATALRWTSANNVGAGDVTPSARLHAKGSTSDSSAYTLKVDNSSNAKSFYVRNDGQVDSSGSRVIGYEEFTSDSTLTQSSKSSVVCNPSGTGMVITMHLSPPGGILQTIVNASAFGVTLGRNGQKIAGLESNYTLPANTSIALQFFGSTLGWLIISNG